MTSQGQTVLVFIGITGLIIPLLILLMAPIALMIAIAYVLNKLGNDSELIVMNAAGMPPWRILSPFLGVGLVVTLMVALLATVVSPKCLRELRQWSTSVRTDMMTNNLQPGRFLVMDGSLTMHIRDRLPNGQLRGVLIDDQRDPKERTTIIAEHGDVLVNDRGSYLVLEQGTVHRLASEQRDPTIVHFEQYAFDLTRLSTSAGVVRYSVQERYPWELYRPAPNDSLFAEQPGQFRAELHNRITAPLYPLAFLIVTFVYLGAPRTTRQSRALSLVGAVGAAATLRGIGYVGTLAGVGKPAVLALPYAALLGTMVLGYWAISRGLVIEAPAFIDNAITAISEKLRPRAAES
jgi:lipopolysaccharide export system permease protein